MFRTAVRVIAFVAIAVTGLPVAFLRRIGLGSLMAVAGVFGAALLIALAAAAVLFGFVDGVEV